MAMLNQFRALRKIVVHGRRWAFGEILFESAPAGFDRLHGAPQLSLAGNDPAEVIHFHQATAQVPIPMARRAFANPECCNPLM